MEVNTQIGLDTGSGIGEIGGLGGGSESSPLEAGLVVVVAVDPVATLRPLFEDDPALEKTALELAPKMRKYVAFIRSVETTYKTSSTELPTPTQQHAPQSPQLGQLSQLSQPNSQLGSQQQQSQSQSQPKHPHLHPRVQEQSTSILDLEDASVATTRGRRGKAKITKRRTNVHLNLVHTAPPTKSRYDTVDESMCVSLAVPSSSNSSPNPSLSVNAISPTASSASPAMTSRKPIRVTNGHGLPWKELYLHTIMDAFASVSHIDERGYRPLLMPCLSSREMRRYDAFQARDRKRESSAFQKRLGVLAPLDPLAPTEPLDPLDPLDTVDPLTTDEELRRATDKGNSDKADSDYEPSEDEKDDVEFAESFTDEDAESECHLSTVISGVSFPLALQTGSVASEYFGGSPWRSASPRPQFSSTPPPLPPLPPKTPMSIAPDSAGPSSWRPMRSPTMRSVRTNASKDASMPQFTASNHNRRNSPTYHDYVTAINMAPPEPSSPKSPTTTHLSTTMTHATYTTQATSIMPPFSRVNSKPIFAPIAWNGVGGLGPGPSPVREEDSISPLQAEEDAEIGTDDDDNSSKGWAHLDLGGGTSSHKAAKRRCAIHVRIWLELTDIQEPEDPRLFFEELKLLRVMERNSDMQYLEKIKQANADRVIAWRKASAKATLPSPPPTSFTSPFSFRRASLPAKRVRRASFGYRRPSLPSSIQSGKSARSARSAKSAKSGRSGRSGRRNKANRASRLGKLNPNRSGNPSTSANTGTTSNPIHFGRFGSSGRAAKSVKPKRSFKSVRRLSAFAKTHRQNVIEAITPPGSRRGSKTQTLYEANKMLTMVMIDEPTPKFTFQSLKTVWKRLTCRQPRPSVSA